MYILYISSMVYISDFLVHFKGKKKKSSNYHPLIHLSFLKAQKVVCRDIKNLQSSEQWMNEWRLKLILKNKKTFFRLPYFCECVNFPTRSLSSILFYFLCYPFYKFSTIFSFTFFKCTHFHLFFSKKKSISQKKAE